MAGFWLYFTLLTPARYGALSVDAVRHAAFLVEHRAIRHGWNLLIYIVFGLLLVVLALMLHERLKASAPALMQVARAFALI